MRTIFPSAFVRRTTAGLLWAGLVLALAACSSSVLPDAAPDSYSHVATVDITASDTPEAIAAAYGADVVSWYPELGRAVLGLHGDSLLAQGRPAKGGDSGGGGKTQPNQDVAITAEASGFSAWAGGVSAWAGGVSAWAGGVSAWAGGTDNPFPGNETVWSQIGIGAAQDLAVNDGAGIKVAVIDTGIDLDHSGFTGRLAPASEWKDFVDGDAYPDEVAGDYYGHGTAVAGIILQAAPNATILPIRVLDANGAGDVTHVTSAIDHAVAMGADVINLSLGTGVQISAIELAIDNAMVSSGNKKPVTVVTSSGNTGDTNVTYPAATTTETGERRALGVGSVSAVDAKSSFSTYGPLLEMLAPGQGITSLYPDERTVVASGTSFAAPWVAGVVALALADGTSLGGTADAIANSGVNVDALNPGLAGMLGKGRLDALAGYLAAGKFR